MACMDDDELTLPMPSTAPHTPSVLQYTGPRAPGTVMGVASFQYRSYQCWNSPARSPVFLPISNMAATKTLTRMGAVLVVAEGDVAQPEMDSAARASNSQRAGWKDGLKSIENTLARERKAAVCHAGQHKPTAPQELRHFAPRTRPPTINRYQRTAGSFHQRPPIQSNRVLSTRVSGCPSSD